MREEHSHDTGGTNALPALAIEVAEQRHLAHPACGTVVIGRELPAQIRIPGSGISRTHVRIEPTAQRWVIIDAGSRNGTFVDGHRITSIPVNTAVTVHLGDAAGIEVRLTPIDPEAGHDAAHSDITDHYGVEDLTEITGEVDPAETTDDFDAAENAEAVDPSETTEGVDLTIARAGAAVAARREELGLSQRKLADDHVVSQSVLVKFERGVHWPRPTTIAKIEAYLKWPPGSIARVRNGAPPPEDESTEVLSPTVQVAVLIDASEIALNGVRARSALLPPTDSSLFTGQIAALLAELRRLERTVATAAQTSTRRPELARLLGQVRRTHAELVARAAKAPAATLGQRLAAVRDAHRLSPADVAAAVGVSIGDVESAEAEHPIPSQVATVLEQFVGTLSDAR